MRFRLVPYAGGPRELADGTHIQPDDRVIELHIDNAALASSAGRSDWSPWRALQTAAGDLQTLDTWIQEGRFGTVRALTGVTLLGSVGRRLGFEVRPLDVNWHSWLLCYFFIGLEAIYHPKGLARLDRRTERRWPVELWMSAALLHPSRLGNGGPTGTPRDFHTLTADLRHGTTTRRVEAECEQQLPQDVAKANPYLQEANMQRVGLFVSAAVGAVLMYLLDPDRGIVRRTTLRDRTLHAGRLGWRWIRNSSVDVMNRMRGMVVESRARMLWQRPSDTVLIERVRSEMGHVIRYPHKVTVTAEAGVIHLSGVVLVDEKGALLAAINRVPGVLGIRDSLEERNSLDVALDPTAQAAPVSAP
jgi:hypothetical protein